MTYTLSTDKAKLDLALIHRVLSASYWAEGRTLETVRASIDGSLCFGVYRDSHESEAQVGFARVITDYATFAYLADVFVVEAHRGSGVAGWASASSLRCCAIRVCKHVVGPSLPKMRTRSTLASASSGPPNLSGCCGAEAFKFCLWERTYDRR